MDMIIVTDHDKVEKDSFYLTDEEWRRDHADEIEKCEAAGDSLYCGYLVGSTTYCVFRQMDAMEVYINFEGEILMECEGEIIESNHKTAFEYEM